MRSRRPGGAVASACRSVRRRSTPSDSFVADNYALLQASRAWSRPACRASSAAAAPRCASSPRCCAILAHACSSTALAFSMHTHQVAIPAWRWRHQKVAAVEPLLQADRGRAAHPALQRRLGLDRRLRHSATKVEGGYRITGPQGLHLRAPAGDLLMTGAITRGEDGTRSVIHFGAPMKAPEVKIDGHLARARHARHRLQRRGASTTCSCRTPASPSRRKAGEWHPVFQIIATIAFPLIYAVYLGRRRKRPRHRGRAGREEAGDRHAADLAGRMDTALGPPSSPIGAMIEVGRAQRALGRERQRDDDRPRAGRRERDQDGGAGAGARRRRRLLPRQRAWSGASATSRARASIRCSRGRRPAMPARWRSGSRSTRCSEAEREPY